MVGIKNGLSEMQHPGAADGAFDRKENPVSLRSIDVVSLPGSDPEIPVVPSAPAAARVPVLVPGPVPVEVSGLDPLAWLVVVRAEGYAGSTLIPLRRWLRTFGEVVLGREGADISFGHPAISKAHTCIAFEPHSGFTIRDLDSTNGTFLAPTLRGPFAPLSAEAPLSDRCAIRLGDVLLVFRSFQGALLAERGS